MSEVLYINYEGDIMTSSLRAVPIEGHITDSAGNVLRNKQVVIKSETPTQVIIVEKVKTDDDGYFKTSPIPNGVYDIYESGVSIARENHTPDRSAIQCFKPNSDNYNTTLIETFDSLVADQDLNSFKWFLQIEPGFTDTFQFGNTFPLYDADLLGVLDTANELFAIGNFFNFSSSSRITTTRFDIEYYSPLTKLTKTYKRIRWSGVPGIKFDNDSKLLIPLDYYSITANMPKFTSYNTSWLTIDSVSAGDPQIVEISSVHADYIELVSHVKVGDIMQLIKPGVVPNGDLNPPSEEFYYGIIIAIGPSKEITLEKWKSSRFTSDPSFNISKVIDTIMVYDGIFPGIFDIDESTNERYTVVEDIYSQNRWAELYNYTNSISLG